MWNRCWLRFQSGSKRATAGRTCSPPVWETGPSSKHHRAPTSIGRFLFHPLTRSLKDYSHDSATKDHPIDEPGLNTALMPNQNYSLPDDRSTHRHAMLQSGLAENPGSSLTWSASPEHAAGAGWETATLFCPGSKSALRVAPSSGEEERKVQMQVEPNRQEVSEDSRRWGRGDMDGIRFRLDCSGGTNGKTRRRDRWVEQTSAEGGS
ncbi:uncharacterized protein LOC114137145 [Xiphophorus couchianus]|uniref:uncharacterized protein LOC114137145 n=1 Tax=Xiphophorus couchianus TaxID=32473 RepID=UPI0010163F63|nr:uncharacterized protein LOC114137145 [Xiphophorus couchianus]